MAGDATGYIKHHLTNLTYGKLPAGYVREGENGGELSEATWTFAQSTQEAVRTFLEFAPVLDHSGNTPVEVDVERILNIVAETGGYAEKFGSHTMMNWSLIDNKPQERVQCT